MAELRRRREDRYLLPDRPATRWAGLGFYAFVGCVYILFSGWTIYEHYGDRAAATERFDQRVRDTVLTISSVTNAQLVMGAFLSRERLEETIGAFILSSRWIRDVDLLSAEGVVLASTKPLAPDGTRVARPVLAGAVPPLLRSFNFRGSPPGEPPRPSDVHASVRPFVLPAAKIPEVTLELVPPMQVTLAQPFAVRVSPLPDEERALLLAALASSPSQRQQLAPFVLHRAVLELDTAPLKAQHERGVRRTAVALLLATLAAGALLLSWRSLQRSTGLTINLVREREVNRHLEEMRLAAAGLAHETRNPLNVVRNIAQSLGASLQDATAKERVMTVVEEVDRINARLAEFIAYSKPREAATTPLDLDEAAGKVARLMATEAEDKKVTLTVEGHVGKVLADEGLLRQALFNLVNNAVAAVPEGGHVVVRLADDGARASVEVQDDGSGVAEKDREDIFKPYFTLKQSGTGLGLAVVRQIATAHGWAIRYVERAGCGAVFRVEGIRKA